MAIKLTSFEKDIHITNLFLFQIKERIQQLLETLLREHETLKT